MIRKIRREEYLKGYGAMSDGERKDYLKRVGEWLTDGGRRLLEATERPMAKAQNIVLLSARWKEQEVTMFAEGARLLSALMDVADTWLPTQLYAKSAYRAVRQVYIILNSLIGVGVKGKADGLNVAINPITGAPMPKKNNTTTSGRGAAAPYNHEPKRAAGAGAGKPQALPTPVVARNTKNTETTEKVGSGVAGVNGTERTVADGQPQNPDPSRNVASVNISQPSALRLQPSNGMVPARPKHIDQYVHLLPEKTQERAKQYGPLKREIEAARENMRLLMNDPHSSAADREKWAKLAARNDEKIAKINAELDREWEKVAATGRVVVDDLGMAHLLPDGEPSEGSRFKVQGSSDKADKKREADAPQEKPETRNQKPETSKAEVKRREYLKKWLRDTRTQPSDERRKQWTKNCKELLALGGEMTDSIRKAGEYYGVDMTKI